MSLLLARASGTPRELGRAQGEAFAGGIAAALDLYSRLPETSRRPSTGPFIDAARASTPGLVAELEGMAEGAGVGFEDIAWLNCMEECEGFEACTTMISGRFLLHAEQWYAGHDAVGVVMADPEDGSVFLSPTCVGFLPAVGMNATGFAQGIDSLTAPDDRVGIPRCLVARLALGADGIDGAIAAAEIPGRAGGYAHVLASAERGLVVETTATAHREIGVAAHTNHYLSGLRGDTASRGSRARLERADGLIRERPPRSLEDCAGLLADHGSVPQTICLHEEGPGASGTVFGFACDLASGRAIVSDGPPCAGRWEEFALDGYRSEEVSGVV